ncbi:DUF309 domain-containing protein [Melghirimyces algeriensis]|uniref:DUF309 domain-containing protein n=1 Tax=Melghirimyces algeriensis TaxID=910412 RepID=A0A521DMT3_9BACL|nr:DUF309 domain-containing protein [Melghirimyces algeriensis]SMO73027.1 hypothetical protein SAMN06264849_106137 [Melghirimyces algeriensis]
MSMYDCRYSPLFIQFLRYFNVDRDYYECHEVLEELWMEEGREPLIQGILQVAVGLYHYHQENMNGARKLFRAALDKLRSYPGDSMGIDLTALMSDVEIRLQRLERMEGQAVAFDDPKIRILDHELKRRVVRGV